MAIEQGIWKIGDQPQQLKPAALADESLLEEMVMKDIAILNRDWLLIGRQVRTSYDKLIDLLAMDANGSIIIVELKRNKTPRDVVAQTLDYASWVVDLSDDQIADIYLDFAKQYGREHATLDAAFEAKFKTKLGEVAVNDSHQMVVVATELDASTERIIEYLSEHASIGINALFFSAFEDGGNQYLSRAWMFDPGESQERAVTKSKKEPWNGEFYVSFGDDRPWEMARQLGFIAGGGGAWYSNTLSMLTEGDRVWVNIPGTGYVGVGIVTGERVRADQHVIPTDQGPRSFRELAQEHGFPHVNPAADDETAEYLVPVRWLHTVDRAKAFAEVGLFGNQNTVCKPLTPKWRHTVERLQEIWGIASGRD